MRSNRHSAVKESRFPTSLFAIYLGVLLIMSGIHTGLIVGMNALNGNEVLQTIVPILYWGIVATGLTLFTRKKTKSTYEEPMQKLAKATKQVANGDFSVYVPTINTTDNMDYLDVMILDFNKMVEELGSIETLKTDFISNVSHEMKTPIAIIKNYAELLHAEQISDEKRKEYAASVESAATRLSNLIVNILKLNKLENQKITPEVQEYDVCRQLCDCILGFEEAWDEKEIELETKIEDMAVIRADENLMELVWNNLLSNAIKYTDFKGKVTISQTSEENYVKVMISDTGCGMSKVNMKHIFDKFYQGDPSHSKEGNGLGLSLVKRVLELMNGVIQVTSEEGVGSTFTVILPTAGRYDDNGGNSNGG